MSEYRNYTALDELEFYGDHVSAMTFEELHSKSDIAAELAYRDEHIETLRQEAIKNLSMFLEANGKIDQLEKQLAEATANTASVKAEGIMEAATEYWKDNGGAEDISTEDEYSYCWFIKYAKSLEGGDNG